MPTSEERTAASWSRRRRRVPGGDHDPDPAPPGRTRRCSPRSTRRRSIWRRTSSRPTGRADPRPGRTPQIRRPDEAPTAEVDGRRRDRRRGVGRRRRATAPPAEPAAPLGRARLPPRAAGRALRGARRARRARPPLVRRPAAAGRAPGRRSPRPGRPRVNFVSISAASVDRDLQRIAAGATGDFKDEFTRGQPQVRAAVVENKVDSRGSVLRAGLVSGDRRTAVVLVAVDATVKNAQGAGRPAVALPDPGRPGPGRRTRAGGSCPGCSSSAERSRTAIDRRTLTEAARLAPLGARRLPAARADSRRRRPCGAGRRDRAGRRRRRRAWFAHHRADAARHGGAPGAGRGHRPPRRPSSPTTTATSTTASRTDGPSSPGRSPTSTRRPRPRSRRPPSPSRRWCWPRSPPPGWSSAEHRRVRAAAVPQPVPAQRQHRRREGRPEPGGADLVPVGGEWKVSRATAI